MSLESILVTAITLLLVLTFRGQSLPQFKSEGYFLSNNSYIYSLDIGDGDRALNCVTYSDNCCNNTDVGGWKDESGRPVYQGADGTTCLYVTRGDGVISLHRKRGCSDHTSGLWRCDIPDSSGESQSLYIYISNIRSQGQLALLSMNFTLHTELRASVPEFTVSCRTHGGPATTIQWTVNGIPVQEDRYHETSQLVLNASLNSVYDNRLRVRGRRNGTYNCTISNNIQDYDDRVSATEVKGTLNISVAGEPTGLTAVISESNSTHVNITVSWESPGNPVTGYVIYYQSKGGPVISDRVSGGETDTHALDGLQRGVTYYISIVALSPHLPSPLVGPITVIQTMASSLATISVTNTASSATTTSLISLFTTSRASMVPSSSVTALKATVASRKTTTSITESSTNSQVPITPTTTATTTTLTVTTTVVTGTTITTAPTITPTSDMVIASPVSQMSTFAKDVEQCITLTTNMVTCTPVSETFSCTKDVDKEPCSAESTAVIAGGVGGGIILCQILVCLPIAIFGICNRSAYSKKVETHSNTAYGVVPARRREEPEYEVINQPLKQTAAKLPLSRNVATASTAM